MINMFFFGILFNVKLLLKLVIVLLVVFFICIVVLIIGFFVVFIICFFIVLVCIIVCILFIFVNIVCGLFVNKVEVIIVENKIFFDENLKNLFFINLKFNINSFIVVFLLYILFDKFVYFMLFYF